MAGNAISRRCGVADAVNGFVIGNESFKPCRRYGAALFAEAALLDRGSGLGHYLASGACGLQNAMISTYSDAVVRTSLICSPISASQSDCGCVARQRTGDA